MKKALIFLAVCITIVACKNADNSPTISPSMQNALALQDSANFTSIQWLDSVHRDLGKVTEGEQVEVSFRFKNTGAKPLIITSVKASCGCTIPETPKEPFAPGAEGFIKAKFNSTNRSGLNNKEVYVMANTAPTTLHQLEFTVQVDKKAGN
ncbi:MAG: DUF1573 domain-containing protein [Bacteroidota bacterium]